ncbi:MAG: aspartyl/asparaginyl beta-hydroxylase domain-containing protein [Chthoniobacterales bacterium]|nr:aspartyl/asparaginyl beta-hydroxylase domain-containing protein [Chthoniobacterales bacterium]
MKDQLRQPLMKYGRMLLQQVQKAIGRASAIGDQAFFPPEQFPWARHIEENWTTIREELDVVLTRREDLPNFQDISPDQKHLAKGDNWKTFFFFAYGLEAPGNCARCPRTMELLKTIPGAKTAFFSILSPRMHIPHHCGPYKGVIRYHLGLVVPEPKEQCRIRVADEIAHWEEGKSMFFDDTFDHEVWNDTDGMRVVLFMDVLRPLRFPMSAINELIIKIIAASPFIRDAKQNHEAWEQKMAQLWR